MARKKFSEIEFVLLETPEIETGQKNLEQEMKYLKTLPIEIDCAKDERLQLTSLITGVVIIYPEKRAISYHGWQELKETNNELKRIHKLDKLLGFVLRKDIKDKKESLDYVFNTLPMNYNSL